MNVDYFHESVFDSRASVLLRFDNEATIDARFYVYIISALVAAGHSAIPGEQ